MVCRDETLALERGDVTDLSRARNGRLVGGRRPIAVEGQTYDLITVLERVEPDIRGDGVPARYECRCICGTLFVAKGADVVRRRKKTCGCRSLRQSVRVDLNHREPGRDADGEPGNVSE